MRANRAGTAWLGNTTASVDHYRNIHAGPKCAETILLLTDEVRIEVRSTSRLYKIHHGVMGFAILLLRAVHITLGLFLIVVPTIVWAQ